jgi:hypothetical protein
VLWGARAWDVLRLGLAPCARVVRLHKEKNVAARGYCLDGFETRLRREQQRESVELGRRRMRNG